MKKYIAYLRTNLLAIFMMSVVIFALAISFIRSHIESLSSSGSLTAYNWISSPLIDFYTLAPNLATAVVFVFSVMFGICIVMALPKAFDQLSRVVGPKREEYYDH